ncbi:CstA-like transporter-associated (seleno)protein, partial [Bacillus thuringiensis]
TYLAHIKNHHPQQDILCQNQFFAQAQEPTFNPKPAKISPSS